MMQLDHMTRGRVMLGVGPGLLASDALMMGIETRPRLFCVNPIVSPRFSLDLVLIEPSRRPMAPGAQAFLQMLQDESSRINHRWEKLLA